MHRYIRLGLLSCDDRWLGEIYAPSAGVRLIRDGSATLVAMMHETKRIPQTFAILKGGTRDPNRCTDNHVWPRSFRSAGAANRNEAIMTEDEKVENTLMAQAIINDAIKKYYERCKEKVMTPTNAQIEAAAKAMQDRRNDGGGDLHWYRQMAKTALTAAAEVGPQEKLRPEFEKVLYDNLWELYARDTMPPTDAQIEAILDEYEDELTVQQRKFIADRICRLTAAAAIRNPQDAYNEIIERCARVARTRAAQYDHQHNNQENALWQECLEIAAEIDALKDEQVP